ncbi:hypothetical protein E2562_039267 [Oryza meyeriana var. granulata]|uniref:Uncharacterized protein n=1 Tax=Oryza meyeriana var. granulata TaxID=110450 RepID=A0A6G1CCR6_9ORYZ|nr:hypothetical protein E2562_039267 [Oryza meyeriana var. granulata]
MRTTWVVLGSDGAARVRSRGRGLRCRRRRPPLGEPPHVVVKLREIGDRLRRDTCQESANCSPCRSGSDMTSTDQSRNQGIREVAWSGRGVTAPWKRNRTSGGWCRSMCGGRRSGEGPEPEGEWKRKPCARSIGYAWDRSGWL